MSQFCNMRSVFKPLVTYFRKILEKLRKFSLRTPEIKKKISLKHPRIKKKNKKKIGSNAKNLRNLEPQPEQTFLIKKKRVYFLYLNIETCCTSFILKIVLPVRK